MWDSIDRIPSRESQRNGCVFTPPVCHRRRLGVYQPSNTAPIRSTRNPRSESAQKKLAAGVFDWRGREVLGQREGRSLHSVILAGGH